MIPQVGDVVKLYRNGWRLYTITKLCRKGKIVCHRLNAPGYKQAPKTTTRFGSLVLDGSGSNGRTWWVGE